MPVKEGPSHVTEYPLPLQSQTTKRKQHMNNMNEQEETNETLQKHEKETSADLFAGVAELAIKQTAYFVWGQVGVKDGSLHSGWNTTNVIPGISWWWEVLR